MVEFTEELRHRCRNPKCRSKLPAPVSNPLDAFCCRGCHTSFYLHRCLVCEAPMERKTGNQKVCRKAKCRSALQAQYGLGRYYATKSAKLTQKVPDFIDPNRPINAGLPSPMAPSQRAAFIRNAVQTEFFGGGKWRKVVSPDGVVCYVTRLWGKEPQAERLAA